MRGDPTDRALRLLSLLQTQRFWPSAELADRLEVTERTVRRDVERLRDLDYRVDSVAGRHGGYRLAAGSHLPPLVLGDDEAVAVAIGLRYATEAAIAGIEETSLRALTTIESLLPHRLRRRVSALHSSTTSVPRTADDVIDPEALSVLAAACRDHEHVRFEYQSGRRLVEPHQLVTAGRRWYLAGWDRDRDDWRTFRVDRMRDPRHVSTHFEPRALPGGTAASLLSPPPRPAHHGGGPHRYRGTGVGRRSAAARRRRAAAGFPPRRQTGESVTDSPVSIHPERWKFDYPIIHAETREQWRAWLSANSATEKGVWLCSWRTPTGLPRCPYPEAVEEAICFGWIDSTGTILDEERGLQLYTRRKGKSSWARLNRERAAAMEAQGLMTDGGRQAIAAAKSTGWWTILDSVEDLIEPPELRAALDASPAARASWDGFPPSARKRMLWEIVSATRDETRAARIATIVSAAAEGRRAYA